MLALNPHQVIGLKLRLLVDIRPDSERAAEVGFVPGSIQLDPRLDREAFVSALQGPPTAPPAVLICMAGVRARQWAHDLSEHQDLPLAWLDGGILAWGGAGLPLCGRITPAAGSGMATGEFTRALMSCFVAELADVAVDTGVDPVGLLGDCFRRAGADINAPTTDDLRRVLDHAAAFSLSLGTPMARIAENVDAMLEQLPR